MNVTKKTISSKISDEASILGDESSSFLNLFFEIIKSQSKKKLVKISNFGTFEYKQTKERIGRNPKTLKEYKIPSIKKLNFKVSSKIKTLLN